MFTLYFYIFQRGFEVLNALFQAFVYATIVAAIVCYNMSDFFDFSSVVQLSIYSKNVLPFSRIKTIHLFAHHNHDKPNWIQYRFN